MEFDATKVPVIGWAATGLIGLVTLLTGRRLNELDQRKQAVEAQQKAFGVRLDYLERNYVTRDTLTDTVDKAFQQLREDIGELKNQQAQAYQNILQIVRDRR